MTKKEQTKLDAEALMHMYGQGYLDGWMLNYKNADVDMKETWNTIRKDCEKAFEARFKKDVTKIIKGALKK